MERFLRYSMERERPIRLMWLQEDASLRQAKALVKAFNEKEVSIHILRPPADLVLRREDVLSADYTRDDDGMG